MRTYTGPHSICLFVCSLYTRCYLPGVYLCVKMLLKLLELLLFWPSFCCHYFTCFSLISLCVRVWRSYHSESSIIFIWWSCCCCWRDPFGGQTTKQITDFSAFIAVYRISMLFRMCVYVLKWQSFERPPMPPHFLANYTPTQFYPLLSCTHIFIRGT